MPYRSQHPCCKCNSSIVSDKVTISCLVLSNKFTHQHKYLQDNAGLILLIVSSWFAVKLFLYFFQLIVAYVAMFFCSFFVFFSSLVHNLLVSEPSVIPRPTMFKFFGAKAKKEKWKKKKSIIIKAMKAVRLYPDPHHWSGLSSINMRLGVCGECCFE